VRATVVAFSSSLSSSRPLLHPIPYLSTPCAPFLTHLGLFTRLKRRSWLAPRLKLTQKLVPCPSNRTLIEKRRGFEKSSADRDQGGETPAASMPPTSAKKSKNKSFNIEIDIFGHHLSHISVFEECQTFALASKITYVY